MSHSKLWEVGCGFPAPIAKRTDKRHSYVKGQPVRFVMRHNKHTKNIKGKTFGRLTVLKQTGVDAGGHALWLCRCNCPARTKHIVTVNNLSRRTTKNIAWIDRECSSL